MYSIYELRSTATDKVYIGCTSQLIHKRFINHISAFNSISERQRNVYAYRQMREENLTILDFSIHKITEIEDRKEAYALEERTIKKYRKTVGVFNCNRAEVCWNKGTKGICKSNSGSIKKGERRGITTEFKKGSTVGMKTRFKKGETNNTAGTVTVHKDNRNHRISPDKLDSYLANGFIKGMKPRKQARGYYERNGRFTAYLTIEGKLKNLGTYDTKEEAQEVRRKAML